MKIAINKRQIDRTSLVQFCPESARYISTLWKIWSLGLMSISNNNNDSINGIYIAEMQ